MGYTPGSYVAHCEPICRVQHQYFLTKGPMTSIEEYGGGICHQKLGLDTKRGP